jgi:Helicase conserved C-terminal domain
MVTKAADVRRVPDPLKEAVVDSILNNLSARVSGRGEFSHVILNERPSDLLVSGFIVPLPEELRDDDEETNPLQINAHGLDFHASVVSLHKPIKLRLKGSIYLRIFPSAAEMAEGGTLAPIIRWRQEIAKDLRDRTRVGMDALRVELGAERFKERSHPEWDRRLTELRKKIHAEIGLPFEREDTQDTMPAPEENDPDAARGAGDENEIKTGSMRSLYGPDDLYQPAEPPQKWIRLDLDLPEFEIILTQCDANHLKLINDRLNAAITQQITSWLEATGSHADSEAVAYKSGSKLLPSHLADWSGYLQMVCRNDKPFAIPELDIRWAISHTADPLKPGRELVHVAVENFSPHPSNRTIAKEVERCLFQVQVTVTLPNGLLEPLLLDRVRPSYRYNEYLEYPALGFNCGVVSNPEQDRHVLSTTWSPRYTLPRVVPSQVSAERRFAELAKPEGIALLAPLVPAFREWIEETRKCKNVDAGIAGPDAAELLAKERAKFAVDLKLWDEECSAIDRGIRLLQESRRHWSGAGPQTDPKGLPFEAWLTMNAAMEEVGKGKYDSWRLFQVAFIVSMIPTFATRIPGFYPYYLESGAAQQANAVTLLYFATGGGKSEAFLGLLLFVLILDRLRGKERGVSALMRYPLRLLTLQQARRTMRVLAAGEVQRISRKHQGEPLSLGFWVGGTNTPNWRRNPEMADVPTLEKHPVEKESELAGLESYQRRKKAWLKIESCPFCGSATVLRRAPKRDGGILGHYCTAIDDKCAWRKRYPQRRPLPFYIVDEDIYAVAPSVLLGTVDKLAVIGQSFKTIRRVFGMFGMAPYMADATGHLISPIGKSEWEAAATEKLQPLFPAFSSGKKAFFDPFPSLLIQDEAHLLEESLGTFAGLFESALEAGLNRLAPLLGAELAADPVTGRRRRIKVIAASATVSEPERQMRHLYQRDATQQFPYPGPSLYASFYTTPKLPHAGDPDSARLAIQDIEKRANSARIYTAIVTNGHRHTVSVASILGQYHLLITQLYESLRTGGNGDEGAARATLEQWLSDSVLRPIYVGVIRSASRDQLLSLIDLHRIALTYVTNKKGGDQVIDTERAEFEDVHRGAGFDDEILNTRLISGAVSASEIQEVVTEAERRVKPGQELPPLSETLRSIIATSAVSHGVDVEEFNAMFFAGLPSDIAEYIQASSRVGRSHVGFSLLIPAPQRQRDRFVVEIFDIYHRFLERMVLPAAVDRWAEKAILRVMPSVIQEYLCGISRFIEIAGAAASQKGSIPDMRKTSEFKSYLDDPNSRATLVSFLIDALGLAIKPPVEGLPYYKSMVSKELNEYRKAMADTSMAASTLKDFFELRKAELRPMTSLRDVDLNGVISAGLTDATGHRTRSEITAAVMDFLRRGKFSEIDPEEDSEQD